MSIPYEGRDDTHPAHIWTLAEAGKVQRGRISSVAHRHSRRSDPTHPAEPAAPGSRSAG